MIFLESSTSRCFHPVLLISAITSMSQDGLTGSAWGDWANYTASPLRAFENELGVQAPVGFWDPAGFTADGSVEDFKRRRATEIKQWSHFDVGHHGIHHPSDLDLLKLRLRSFKTISVKIIKACFFVNGHFCNSTVVGWTYWQCVFFLECIPMKQSPGDQLANSLAT